MAMYTRVLGIVLIVCWCTSNLARIGPEESRYLRVFGDALNGLEATMAANKTSPLCNLVSVGTEWGLHYLCAYTPLEAQQLLQIAQIERKSRYKQVTWPKLVMPESQMPPRYSDAHPAPCHFISFGISGDYSFDKAMYEKFQCTGLALDPTVTYPRNLTTGVTFLKAGANMKSPVPDKWYTWSVPSLFQAWGVPSLYALKMDCEGCEYQLAQDIVRDNPHFLHSVLQLNIEMHFPKGFMKSEKELVGLARLTHILRVEGFSLVHMDNGRCDIRDLEAGCLPEMETAGIKCEPGCRSYLFARLPKK